MTVKADLRNIATIERLCKEITRQCAFYRRNCQQGDDSARFIVIFEAAIKLDTAARHGLRRYYKRWKQEHE